jgi:glucokinase
MPEKPWAIGVDLGGTKVEIAQIDDSGNVLQRLRRPTDVKDGYEAVISEIVSTTGELHKRMGSPPAGVGVGVAGQIEAENGFVYFAPNLDWRDVPFETDLSKALKMPVIVTNDVRAATWGEWLHGAGQGCKDLICLFVGTGIGGGVVSSGQMLSGCTNTAGELGHIPVELRGPICHCGNRGCLEAHASGWAIAGKAKEAIQSDPQKGRKILELAGGSPALITAKAVVEAAHSGDQLSLALLDVVSEALIAGCTGLINAFNPCRLILGGGVIEGMPELVEQIARGVKSHALEAATTKLEVLPAQLHNDAGVIGAGSLAIHRFAI